MTLIKPNIDKPAGSLSEWREKIEAGKCTQCGRKIKESDFRDDLSKKEYTCSGMCQKCQDETFWDETVW